MRRHFVETMPTFILVGNASNTLDLAFLSYVLHIWLSAADAFTHLYNVNV